MAPLTEETFRAHLDARGVLQLHPQGKAPLAPPDRERCYAVFAQRADARLDVGALRQQASRFFATKLGVTVDKHYDDLPPSVDAARVVIASEDGAAAAGTRLCYGRPADRSDVAAAEAAERAQGTTGLALLAQRCETLWIIEPETDDDRVALTIAAVLASVMLGPILIPGGAELLGVRSARLKLEGKKSPYR